MKKRKMQKTLASILLLPQIRLLLLGLFLFTGVAIFSSFFTPDTAHAAQTVPYQMNFQGRLNDSTGAPMPNGTYNMKFRIYSALSGGSALWSEQRSVFSGTGVTITTGGLFSVQLGSVTGLPPAIFNTATPLYLEVELPTPATATCSGSGCESYTEGAMTPRNPVVSSPFAINSQLLNGLDSTAFAQATGGTGYIQNQTASAQAASFRINGTGTIQGSSTTAFQVQNASSVAVFTVDTTTNTTNIMGNLNIVQVAAPPSAPTPAVGAAGSLIGTFYYVVTYVTAAGETNPSPNSGSVTVAAQQVNLTAIPTSASSLVTARNIYRGTSYNGPFSFVTTINDNTTTTYTDNIVSLGALASGWNTTGGSLQQNGATILQVGTFGSGSVAVGQLALTKGIGVYNTAIGLGALGANTGSYNTASGSLSLYFNTTGSHNTASGFQSLYSNTTGSGNTALGAGAGYCDIMNYAFCTGAALQNATAIGTYAQVQANNTLVLGSVDNATQTVIGATVPVGTNLFGVSPVDLNSPGISATQATTTVTAFSPIFSAANVGEILVWADGTTNTITAYTDSTHVTVQNSATHAASKFRTHRVGFQVTNTGNAYIQNSNAAAFSVQNASGVSALNVDTTTNTITLGSVASGNYLSFTPSGGLTAIGTARHTKTILLPAEYTGAVLDAVSDPSCSSANSGTMTSGYDNTSRMNYYNWTSASGAAQCYDVVVQVPIPSDFNGWASTPDIRLMKDATGTAAYAIQIIDATGTTDSNYNYANPTAISTSWANLATSAFGNNLGTNGTTSYVPGSYFTIKVRMSSTSSANVKLGNIKLTYYSSF